MMRDLPLKASLAITAQNDFHLPQGHLRDLHDDD